MCQQDHRKTVLLAVLTLACLGLAYYSHFVLETDTLYSHFFYVPVALAGLWWGRRGTWVGALLGAALLGFHLLSDMGGPIREDLFRAVMFVVVGLTVGILREQAFRSEQALRQTRDYLDSLIRHANAPIIVWDPAFRITRFNRAFEHLTGLDADDVIGAPLEILFPDEREKEALDHIRRTVEGERWEVLELPIQSSSGSVRTVLWNSANVYAADGRTVIATIAQGQDITERRQAEEVLRRTERLAAMGRLAAALAHEINNPLQAIRSHLELVLDFGLEADEREQYLGVCQQEIEHLADITQRVLSFARPPKDERHLITVEGLVAQTLALVGKQLQRAQIEVSQDLPHDLPPVWVAPDQMVQVLLNIMINATEVMPEGGHVHIAGRVRRSQLVLMLANDGPPIPGEHLDRVFDPFFSTKPDGTGLGLPVSYSIVQGHGGDIRAENLPGGRGVCFTISLPLGQAREPTAAEGEAL